MSIQDTQKAIVDLVNKLPKAVKIEIPSEIKIEEMIYVTAILEAFAEDAGVDLITKDELISKADYGKYKKKFDRYRADYFKAEGIRESLKDASIEKKLGSFTRLEEDTYNAVIDKVEDDYETSYKRMNCVLEHVTTISLNSLLEHVSGWLGNSEKKGICHILVNEKRL
ncbi:ABC-three component system protein [[Mycoplasma] imitans]|uniref:ABC-three component system protein n=1 Tax=[Mycoplasma] imitans TaxID=29560 RepID=UPI0004835543|nr:ABC-three component system protein [[Mycoplasma] imitans]